jgi:hypothetical protein
VGFTISLNGEVIHEIDIDPRLVSFVHLMTAAGEAGVAGTPTTGLGSDNISLVIDYVSENSLPVKEALEAEAAEAARLEEGKEEQLNYNVNNERFEATPEEPEVPPEEPEPTPEKSVRSTSKETASASK